MLITEQKEIFRTDIFILKKLDWDVDFFCMGFCLPIWNSRQESLLDFAIRTARGRIFVMNSFLQSGISSRVETATTRRNEIVDLGREVLDVRLCLISH